MIFTHGDATKPAERPAIIAHICNDQGRWGRGFVVAVSRRWPEPEQDYRRWYRDGAGLRLGATQLVEVESGLWVANMIGQHGTGYDENGGPPIRYQAVAECLNRLGDLALLLHAAVHMPRIGCGLAGGTWDRIGPLVDAALGDRDVPVTVYDWP